MIISVKKTIGLTFIMSGLILAQSFGQKKEGIFSRKKIVNQYSTVGIGGGSSHYFGDLAPLEFAYYGLYTNVRWNGTINYTRHLNENIAARASFTYARIFGDDYTFSKNNISNATLAAHNIRNLHFRNDLQEFVLSGIYNLLPQYGKGAKGRSSIMPYLTAGIGVYGHKPKAVLRSVENETYSSDIEWVALRPLNTSGQNLPAGTLKNYSLVQFVAPVSIGVRLKISKSWDLKAEAGYRWTPTDFLDDVGNTNYPNLTELGSNFGDVAKWMSFRADEDLVAANPKFRGTSNNNRISDYLNAVPVVTGTNPPGGSSPSNSVKNYYSPDLHKRGTKGADSYLLFQVTLNYVLSNNIKCPVIR